MSDPAMRLGNFSSFYYSTVTLLGNTSLTLSICIQAASSPTQTHKGITIVICVSPESDPPTTKHFLYHSHIYLRNNNPICLSKTGPKAKSLRLIRRYAMHPRCFLPACAYIRSRLLFFWELLAFADLNQLSKYPVLNNLEKQTSIPKAYAVLGLVATYFFFIFFNIGGQLLTNFAGFVIPGYYSLEALFSAGKADDTQWLTVWPGYFWYVLKLANLKA